jgi:adenylate cyclase class 2
MYEVELKVRTPHDPVEERLRALKATQEATVEQIDTYYDAPHRNFAETDEALRLREESVRKTIDEESIRETTSEESASESTTELTYKGPLVGDGTKTREEHETRVADGEAMDAALRGLGFEGAHVVEKVRRRYSLRRYTVTLDRVRGLGEFVEVERAVPEPEVETAREGAIELLRDLNLDPDGGITTSYLGLLLEERVLSAGESNDES